MQYPSIDNFFRSKRVILSLTLKVIRLVCCGSIRRLIISFALNGSYCRSRLKNEVYMYIWLVCYCSIPWLIISFALNGSCCRSRLKNELYMYICLVCCGSIRRFIIPFASNTWWDAFDGPYTDCKLRLRSVQTVRMDKPLWPLRSNNTWLKSKTPKWDAIFLSYTDRKPRLRPVQSVRIDKPL